MKLLSRMNSFKTILAAALFCSAFATAVVQAQNNSNSAISEEPISHAQEAISEEEIAQILAPIALYPDTILSHILVAATYPIEVVQAERWTLKNSELQGQEAVEAAVDNDWDPSVQALVAFPQILKRMSQELEWTQRLGDAFIHDEEQVLAAVQNLRELAKQAGSLEEMEQMTVIRDERNIILEPREREVVYVPYYDTRSVYGAWPWRHYQPTYWGYPYADSLYYDDYYAHNHRGPFYWGPRISLSFGFFSNTFHWRNRHLVRIASRHYRPHRYYGHHDILGHRYAQRWVHDRHRRHSNRNRHVSRYGARGDGRKGESERGTNEGGQAQANQRRQQSSQAQIRNRLINRRTDPVKTYSSRGVIRPQNRAVTNRRHSVDKGGSANRGVVANRNASVNRSAPQNRSAPPNRSRATPNRSTIDSRIVLEGRTRGVEGNRRIVNRSVTRPVNRQPTVNPRRQPNRSTTTSAPSRSAARPARQQAVSRPAPRPRSAVERKSAPNKARGATHRDKRQPR